MACLSVIIYDYEKIIEGMVYEIYLWLIPVSFIGVLFENLIREIL